ncbi:AI-2E family transporter [Candidatus Tiddalikarchaeum anstoanum]|nr:AI-2E family transporter [Candidatus Tiddalikarchaeum anstoanum]
MENKKTVFSIFTLILGILLFIITGRFIIIILTSIFISFLIRPLYKLVKKAIKNSTISAVVSELLTLSLIFYITFFVFNSVYYQIKLLGSSFITETLFNVNESLFNNSANLDFNNLLTLETFNNSLSFLQSVITNTPLLILDIFLIIFLSYYFIKDSELIQDTILNMIPARHKEPIIRFLKRSKSISEEILYSYFLTALFVGLLLFILLNMLNVHFSLDYAIFAAIASLFPIIGTWIVPVFLAIYFFFRSNYFVGVILLIYAVLIVYITNVFRFIIKRTHEKVHPLLFIMGVFVGFYSLGFLGFLTGPIIFGILQIGFEEVFREYLKNAKKKP